MQYPLLGQWCFCMLNRENTIGAAQCDSGGLSHSRAPSLFYRCRQNGENENWHRAVQSSLTNMQVGKCRVDCCSGNAGDLHLKVPCSNLGRVTGCPDRPFALLEASAGKSAVIVIGRVSAEPPYSCFATMRRLSVLSRAWNTTRKRLWVETVCNLSVVLTLFLKTPVSATKWLISSTYTSGFCLDSNSSCWLYVCLRL